MPRGLIEQIRASRAEQRVTGGVPFRLYSACAAAPGIPPGQIRCPPRFTDYGNRGEVVRDYGTY